MKFVAPLDDADRLKLMVLMRDGNKARVRQRAHAILLSEKGYKLDQIADILQIDRDTVSRQLDNWTTKQFEGLEDGPRSGRPRKRR